MKLKVKLIEDSQNIFDTLNTNEGVLDYIRDNVDFKPLFSKINAILGYDCNFILDHEGYYNVYFKADNISDSAGILKYFIYPEITIEFGDDPKTTKNKRLRALCRIEIMKDKYYSLSLPITFLTATLNYGSNNWVFRSNYFDV